MKNIISVLPSHDVNEIQMRISQDGYAIANVSDRETYMEVSHQLGAVGGTRDIIVSPDKVQPFTGYSYKPDEVPFHTDYPLIGIVGLYCVTPDKVGGDNLLIDSRSILSLLTPEEIMYLEQVNLPLPRSTDIHPVLSATPDQLPHIFWLPFFIQSILPKLDPSQAAAITRFDQLLLQRRRDRDYITIRLASGEALWFNNYVMLHGRDQLELSSPRHQVRVFISTNGD